MTSFRIMWENLMTQFNLINQFSLTQFKLISLIWWLRWIWILRWIHVCLLILTWHDRYLQGEGRLPFCNLCFIFGCNCFKNPNTYFGLYWIIYILFKIICGFLLISLFLLVCVCVCVWVCVCVCVVCVCVLTAEMWEILFPFVMGE